MEKKGNPRVWYLLCLLILLTMEVLIALFVRDAFIRPYGGDILVTILICCLVRTVYPFGIRLLPVWVFLFAAAVEVAQYFDIVSLLGLGDIAFFRILLGTSFSFIDLICYAAGCFIFFVVETSVIALRNRK